MDLSVPENIHFPRPTLLSLENTHNVAGGKVYPLEEFEEVAGVGQEMGLKIHLDGARLFNAQAATGIPAREWCANVDTVSVCSSKGLGAPVGSLLAGDEETIREARRARKAFGGGMRQAGIVAAASLYAFEHNIERLSEDHERAEELASGLEDAGYDVRPPDTNIVLVQAEDPIGLLEALSREGVLATPGGHGAVRFCTHLDITDEDVKAAVEVASRILTEAV